MEFISRELKQKKSAFLERAKEILVPSPFIPALGRGRQQRLPSRARTRGEGRERLACLPPSPPACRSAGRTFDNELHFPQRWLWSTWETRNVTGIDVTRKGTEASRHPPPLRRSPHVDQRWIFYTTVNRFGGGGAGVFRPPSRVVTSARSDVPVRMDNRLRIFIPLLLSLLPWNFRIFFNFGGWNSLEILPLLSRSLEELGKREMLEKYRSNLSFFLFSLTEIKKKYKSFFPCTKSYFKDLIFLSFHNSPDKPCSSIGEGEIKMQCRIGSRRTNVPRHGTHSVKRTVN